MRATGSGLSFSGWNFRGAKRKGGEIVGARRERRTRWGKNFFLGIGKRRRGGGGGREKGDINKSIPLARSPRATGWPGGSRLPRFFDTGHIAKSNWSIEKQPSFEWA